MIADNTHRNLIRLALKQAEENFSAASDFGALLESLDTRIRRAAEALSLRAVVPKDLRDDYRQEVDALILDNTQLAARLVDSENALARTKTAYRDELRHTTLLEQKLEEMERRLTGVIRNRALLGEVGGRRDV